VFRYIVAFCAVCFGGVIAAADYAVSLPLLPPHERIPGKKSPQKERLVVDACIALYGIAYSTGRLLYRWLGAHAEAAELRRWSRWHMVILNAVGGGWLLSSGWQPLQHAVVRPSLVVGVLLLALTTYDGWRGLRALRGQGLGEP
jgi:hypothetical protein